MAWPADTDELEALQLRLARLEPELWSLRGTTSIGGCFACFRRGGTGVGRAGDEAWGAAVVMRGEMLLTSSQATGVAGGRYRPGLLAVREGQILQSAVSGLERQPDVLLVNATGRDHPRRAGLAIHLGWALGLPTVGVTHRPLLATGRLPEDSMGARSPLWIDDDQVGWWLRVKSGVRPLAVSTGWAVDLVSCCEVVGQAVFAARTPEPLRQARWLARTARSRDSRDSDT